MMYCKCEVLIPLRYGKSRRPVEDATFLRIIGVFNRQFGGFTPLGLTGSPEGVTQGGLWHDDDTGEVIEDRSWLVRVYVLPERVPEFEAIVRAIGRELEQKEMCIDIGLPTGKFLRIYDGHGDDADDIADDLDIDLPDDGQRKGDDAEAAS